MKFREEKKKKDKNLTLFFELFFILFICVK